MRCYSSAAEFRAGSILEENLLAVGQKIMTRYVIDGIPDNPW